MSEIRWGGVAVVAGLYAVFLVVGWLASRKVKEGTPADLLVAGRSLPLWIAVMTMTATWIDGGYLNGTTEAVYTRNLAWAFQPGLCFGLSLILGGVFFARTMRRHQFTTLIDPFAVRFGKRWAAVLAIPALGGETFWSAALLVAIGSTFQILLGLPLTTAIVVSAVVVTAYTMVGGMWSVAWTDAVQLMFIPTGLIMALVFALPAVGGLEVCWQDYTERNPGGARLFPPLTADGHWTAAELASWWDTAFMLVCGGIPWNCYFQRVLSCQTPGKAATHSILSGILTILMTAPPLILGLVASRYFRGDQQLKDPASALPELLRQLTPAFVGLLGLAAIVGAVTSSYSSSILSAGSMTSWNVYRPLLAPAATVGRMRQVIRLSVVLVSVVATVMAVRAGSVFDLWVFTGDLVFVLLFPQLVMALFDPKTNRIGSIVGFVVSLAIRLGPGLPLLGLRRLLDYPRLLPAGLVGDPEMWYDPKGEILLPYRTAAALAGLLLIPLVSRLTARWDPPKPLASGGA